MANSFGPYTPIRQAGDYYFVSGQIGVDSNKHAENNVQKQTQQTLENLADVLKTAGLNLDNLVKTTIFLKDMNDFQVCNEVYSSYFSDRRPARSCIAVADLPHVADNELLIEIEAVAYKEPQI
jgi:2-iminobutanoate/2-iminopropanoate deaminase